MGAWRAIAACCLFLCGHACLAVHVETESLERHVLAGEFQSPTDLQGLLEERAHPNKLSLVKAAAILEKLVSLGKCADTLLGANFPTSSAELFENVMRKAKIPGNDTSVLTQVRQCLFLINAAEADRLNAQSKGPKFSPNEFSVLTTGEFRHLYAGLIQNNNVTKSETNEPQAQASLLESTTSSFPTSMSWVGTAIPQAPENQHQCGGCWAFSASQAIMAKAWITANASGSNPATPPQELSAQQLISCAGGSNQGCNGGNYLWVWNLPYGYSTDHYLTSASIMPFDQEQSSYTDPCPSSANALTSGVSAKRNVNVGQSAEALVAALVQNPVSISIDASASCFQSYVSGTLTENECEFSCGSVDHAVLAVGYKNYGTDDFAIQVKNSWGYWGEQGYVWISGASTTCPYGLLNMFYDPAYPEYTTEQGTFPPTVPGTGSSVSFGLVLLVSCLGLLFQF